MEGEGEEKGRKRREGKGVEEEKKGKIQNNGSTEIPELNLS